MKDTYDAVYTRWLNDPENFWAEAAEAVNWHKKWDRVLDDSRPHRNQAAVAARSSSDTVEQR